MHDLTALQRDILFVIHGLDDPTTDDINRELTPYYETDALNRVRLTNNLGVLADKELVTRDDPTDHSLSDITYEITARGRRELETHRNWQDTQTPDVTDSPPTTPDAAPDVGLDEGVTVTCPCGWYGWITPTPYTAPATVERDCPDCDRHIRVTCTAEIAPDRDRE